MALGKEICKKNKIKILCRGPDGWPSAKADGARLTLLNAPKLPRASLPRAFLCRGSQLAALGKECLCRVLEIWPSAKNAFPVVLVELQEIIS